MASDTCTMCGKEHGVDGWDPRHRPVFANGGGESLPRKDERRHQPMQVGVATMPFDPVLRQALVDKGILTPQDLRDAQDKIEAITGVISHRANRSPESGASVTGSSD